MFDKEKIKLVAVRYQDEFDKLYKGIESADEKNAVCLDRKPSEEELAEKALRNDSDFFNVYYDSQLIGYILIELRTLASGDIHWGIISSHRYLTKIIEEAFNKFKKTGHVNIFGYTPTNNKVAMRIAERLEFEPITTIDGYYSDGGECLISLYKNN